MQSGSEVATLGGGCFWCLEAVFEQLHGVSKVVSGYAGGKTRDPTYEEVSEGDTGHAEVTQVTFDPTVLPYEELLRVFFTIHDPTTPDRQGPDVGPQYRSIILYHTPGQKASAEQIMKEVAAEEIWDAPLVTQLVALDKFFMAEDYHQGYYRRNPYQGYCRGVIAPKVAKFRKAWAHRLRVPAPA